MHSTPNFPDDPARGNYQGVVHMAALACSCSSGIEQLTAKVGERLCSCRVITQQLPQHVGGVCNGAGINNCTQSKYPRCGPRFGQARYGQSYLCVSLDSTGLDAVAKVLRGNGLVVFASNIADAADGLPNVAALIAKDSQGEHPAKPGACFGRPSC